MIGKISGKLGTGLIKASCDINNNTDNSNITVMNNETTGLVFNGVKIDIQQMQKMYLLLSNNKNYIFQYKKFYHTTGEDISSFFGNNSVKIAEVTFTPAKTSLTELGDYNAIKVIAIEKNNKIYLAIPLITKEKHNDKLLFFPSEMLMACIYKLFIQTPALKNKMSIDGISFHHVTEQNITDIYSDIIDNNNSNAAVQYFANIIEKKEDNSFISFQSWHETNYYNIPSLVNHPFYKLIKRILSRNAIFAIKSWQEKDGLGLGFCYYLCENPILSSIDSKILLNHSNYDYNKGNQKTINAYNKIRSLAEKYKEYKKLT
jgi:hypothetical protein